MSLKQKLVAVAGGTGNVGEGVVRAFLGEGARVIVPSRSEERLDLLRRQLGDRAGEQLIGIVGDTSTFAGMRQVADGIASEHGPIHHVVTSLGEWWQGKPVWEVSEEEFQRYFVHPSALHFGAARAFMPNIADGGSYTFLAGLSAQCLWRTCRWSACKAARN